jgi:cytochrome b561
MVNSVGMGRFFWGQFAMRWSFAIRLLHWLSAVVLAAQAALAFGPMKGPGMAAMLWLPSHISIGVIVLLLTALRLVLRIFTPVPARCAPPLAKAAASTVQWSLYAVLVTIPVTGWLAYRPMPLMAPARLFGGLPIPTAPTLAGLTARDFIALHSVLFWVFAVLVAIHIMSALTHAIVFRDGVVSGMLFKRSHETTVVADQ